MELALLIPAVTAHLGLCREFSSEANTEEQTLGLSLNKGVGLRSTEALLCSIAKPNSVD